MIPRDGGNQFRGTVFASGGNSSFQSENLDDDLVALGFMAPNKVKSIYDVNLTYGGPIVRNRLWFFSTYRRWSANNYLGNTFDSHGEQAVDDQRISDGTVRFTWQAAKQHKFALHYDRSAKWRGHRPNNWIGASINEPVSSVEQVTGLNYIGQVKWSSPISNKLLTEVSVFTLPVNYNLQFQKDADPNAVATFDQIRSIVDRRVAAAGHQHGADVHLRRFCGLRHRGAQPQDGHASAHRVVAGTVRDPRRHRADRLERHAAVGPAGQQRQRSQGIRDQRAASTSRTRGRWDGSRSTRDCATNVL